MQTVRKKSAVESPPSKPTTAKESDIASVPVPDTLARSMLPRQAHDASGRPKALRPLGLVVLWAWLLLVVW